MNIPIFLLGLIAITVGGTLAVIMTYRAKRMIYAWAHRHRYQILHLEWRWVRLGPYFLKSSKNQMIYRVKLQKQNGQVAHCWIRCGSWILGVFINEIDVIWDQV
ncbi:MAG TPA: hypothetical protein PLU80_06535 [Acidobacteriota bacterium]|nr:hypothetical protein [Acidobacteriota bacterium]